MGPDFEPALARYRHEGLARSLVRTTRDAGRLDFTTNDTLGLATHPAVRAAARAALEEVGAAGSRLLGGDRPEHVRLEEDAAAWLGVEATRFFPSGYQANIGLLQTVVEPGDALLSDAMNHASLIDACRLTKGTVRIVPHLDVEAMEAALLATRDAARRWILVESIYSMSGARAPLDALHALAEQHDAWLLVDEAHAVGLCGPGGVGCVGAMASIERVAARVITGGKALGVAGALVAGSRALVDLMLHRARSLIFTTAPMPSMAAALRASIGIVRDDPRRATRARGVAGRLRDGLVRLGLPPTSKDTASPIVFVPLGTPARAQHAATSLRGLGIDAHAVRPPTVPQGQSGIRFVCREAHTDADIDALLEALAMLLGITQPVAIRHASVEEAASHDAIAQRPVVIVGTDTDVGKTVVSAWWALRQRHAGARDVRYWKMVQTGTVLDRDTVLRLTHLDPETSPEPVVALPLPASIDQAAAAAGVTVRVAEVAARVHEGLARAPNASWVLETAGGLRVPFGDAEDQVDLLVALGLPVVLVARTGLGTLNHTRLSLEVARRHGLEVQALVLVGPAHPANVATLRTWEPGLPLLHLPHFEHLDHDALTSHVAEAEESRA